jgi:hypothetical protein
VSPHDWQTILDTRQAVRNLGKVLCAKFLAGDGDLFSFVEDWLCAVEEEWTVVGADGLKRAFVKSLPQPRIVFLRAHRRGANPFRAIGTTQLIN